LTRNAIATRTTYSIDTSSCSTKGRDGSIEPGRLRVSSDPLALAGCQTVRFSTADCFQDLALQVVCSSVCNVLPAAVAASHMIILRGVNLSWISLRFEKPGAEISAEPACASPKKPSVRHIVAEGVSRMSIRSSVIAQVQSVAKQQGRHLAPLSDSLLLLESGLDSLCLAILVASLDDELGLDPLSSEANISFPVTLGDFISVYEAAATPADV
jgi:acyl carrier protein